MNSFFYFLRDILVRANFSAIIVAGGIHTASVEVLHSDGTPWCSLPNLLEDRCDHTQTGLLTCGGMSYTVDSIETSCVKFSEGEWKPSHKLKKHREGHSSWASPAGTVLMGGHPSYETTELLDATTGNSVMHFPLKNHTW